MWTLGAVAGEMGRRAALRGYASTHAAAVQPPPPDQRLWSVHRVRAWAVARSGPAAPVLGVLRIPRLRLEVPVFAGTGDAALDSGTGHIVGTAPPGGEGNVGIAGHRDGYFRVLERIRAGDVIELESPHGRRMYRVHRTWIVAPEEVSVLDPTSVPALTLVTCYPFYYVGSAPHRFIVRAVGISSH